MKKNSFTDIDIKKAALHPIPDAIKEILLSHELLLKKWNLLTDVARNEWICWINSAKKTETQQKRIKRFQDDILSNKKRPCCWPGCPHRNPNAAKWQK